MGEEEKKPEEPKTEEAKTEEAKKPEAAPAEEKKEEKPADEKKDEKEEAAPPPPPPPPTEVVMKVFMHCEGCAKKVRRCLRGFDGVEDVMTDCKSSKVVVKGAKAAADPMKVVNRVQRKSHRQVELISPIPKPPPPPEEKPKEEEKPKPEEKKEEPKVIIVVLKVHMHCEACAQEIKKRIQRMKGVESVEPDLKGSQVTVKGVFDPARLVEYVYKRTGKHAVVVKEEPEKKEEKPKEDEAAAKEEKKEGGEEKPKDGGEEKKGEEEQSKEKKEGEEGKTEEEGKEAKTEETKMVEMKRNEYYYYPPRYGMELYAYPPQMFSDENPNACSLM